jgi:inorganic pyrophosphatase
MSTDYYTSNSHSPVKELAQKCTSGAAINIIYGLAVGYMSTIIPIVLLAVTIIVATNLLGMLGVALAAIGMLSTLAVGLAIDAYGPISDNAGGIAEMCECEEHVREYTDALDAAGNTTAAVGKGFAIGSAALVSLALYGAFITRAQQAVSNRLGTVQVIDGWVFGSMLIGAMLPYWFSALTMKSVGKAAEQMVANIRGQFQKMKDDGIKLEDWNPDYDQCIAISTVASLKEMIAPAMLVMLTPIFCGVVFGTRVVAGILPGALLSGVQLAVSMSNTGGAWDNAKKFIEGGNLKNEAGETLGKGTEEHKAAVIGDTVGDPLKDTSGPSLNILIKLMAIISLVFANGFSETSWLAGPLGINSS